MCLPCRFGGALDGAARQFTQAYDSNMIPMEFVNTMRKQHQLIMGIGHKVKSVSTVLHPATLTKIHTYMYLISFH